jgi:predicted KAP-like P-loop ATPase
MVDDVLRQVGKQNDEALRQGLEMATRIAPLLANASRVQGNPRIVKRLLNVVRMRSAIARKRKMPLEETVIAKLALFERCTDAGATEALNDAINNSQGGKLPFLTAAENGEPFDELKATLPDAWQKHLAFVADWVRLDPKLSDIDLRPAVYLARETVAMRFTATTLPANVAHAVEELLKTATLSSRAAATAIGTLTPTQHVAAMEALVAEVRKDAEWARVRPDIRGAVLLARTSTDAAKVITRFIRSLPSRPPWLHTMLRDEAWFEE